MSISEDFKRPCIVIIHYGFDVKKWTGHLKLNKD